MRISNHLTTLRAVVNLRKRPTVPGGQTNTATIPGVDDYKRPGGVDTFNRPGGVDLYKRP